MENSIDLNNIVKKNKKLKTLIIISSVLLILSLSFITSLYFFATTNCPQFLEEPSETNPDQNNTNNSAESVDVSKYTDIVLENYDNLTVGIFNGYYKYEGILDPEYYFSGIVEYSFSPDGWYSNEYTYEEKNERFDPRMSMYILNEKSIVNDSQQNIFDQAKKDIINKNLNANYLDIGTLAPFDIYLSSAAYVPVKSFNNIEYDNTDDVFTLLTLGGYQDHPYVYDLNEEINYISITILIFAIKGDNLISLELFDYNTQDLNLSDTEHLSCSKKVDIGDEEEEIYDLECIAKILQDEKYSEKFTELADKLVERFALAN